MSKHVRQYAIFIDQLTVTNRNDVTQSNANQSLKRFKTLQNLTIWKMGINKTSVNKWTIIKQTCQPKLDWLPDYLWRPGRDVHASLGYQFNVT